MQGKVIGILLAVMFVYAVLGGVIFHYIESANEEQATADINNIIRAFNVRYPCVPPRDVLTLLSQVGEAYSNGIMLSNGTTTTSSNWDFASAIFFSVTVITTIGYGNISPSTTGGRTFCVFFAMIGIPLFLITAGAIGDKINVLSVKIQEKVRCKRLENRPKAVKSLATLFVVLLGVLLFMLLPAVIMQFIEGWSYRDSVYYTYITLTTIGFGDYVAGAGDTELRALYRLCVAIWILLGLSWMAGLISSAQETYGTMLAKAENTVSAKLGASKPTKQDDPDEITVQNDKEKPPLTQETSSDGKH